MNLDTADTKQEETQLQDLKVLLEKQIEGIKKSDFRSAEAYSQQADVLIAEVVKIRLSDRPELKDRIDQCLQLYGQLELIIAAEKESVREQLCRVENGKKTIQIYHSGGYTGASY